MNLTNDTNDASDASDANDANDANDENDSSNEGDASDENVENDTNEEPINKKKVKAVSFDVKGLFPAMTRSESRLAVIEMVENSDVNVQSVNYEEAVKFIAVMYSKDDISKHGLSSVIPAREKEATRQLTVNCLKTPGGWLPAAQNPNDMQKQKILALVVAAGVDVVFANHCYRDLHVSMLPLR